MSNIPIYAIAAMCDATRGIGYKNKLPWSLPNEYNYFLCVSTRVKDQTKRNAVVIGRLTFDSLIQSKIIPNYIYVVVSNTVTKQELNLDNQIDGNSLFVVSSYSDAIDHILNNHSNQVENIFVLGGSSIYKSSFEYKRLDRLYLTHIYKDFECDVFLQPENFLDSFEKIENFKDFNVEGFEIDKLITEPTNNIQYRFLVYSRKF